jgi:arylsulfatase A-like enzyme
MPTLAQRLGQTPLNHQDGRSLLPFLSGGEPAGWRDAAFWEFDFRDIAGQEAEAHFGLDSRQCNLAVLRDERFKYVHFAGLPPLLFDLGEDPDEMCDRSGDPSLTAVRLDFAERLLSLRATHLDQTLAGTMLTEAGPVSLRSAV